jgi:hypothetical protein
VGLVPKLFGITTTIAEVILALLPGDCAEEIRSSIQDHLLTKQFLLSLAHVKPVHRKILREKICKIINRLYSDSRPDCLLLDATSSDALAEAVLPGEPRTYDARSQVSCQKAFLLHIAKLA